VLTNIFDGTTVTIPTRPDRPSPPATYEGVYKTARMPSRPYPVKLMQPYLSEGGWGSFTSGMLQTNLGDKSFGVFG